MVTVPSLHWVLSLIIMNAIYWSCSSVSYPYHFAPNRQIFYGFSNRNKSGINDSPRCHRYAKYIGFQNIGLGIGYTFMVNNQLQPTDRLLIIFGSSHFFSSWVLEV